MATAAENLPAERSANPITVFRQTLETMRPELKMALPAHIPPDKFARVAQTAINNNPDLLGCDRRSLLGAIVRLAQDGLLPDGREAALVKFRTKEKGQYVDKVQAMPMIFGILKKLRQSGEVAKVSAQVVYENDEFVWHLGFDESVTHQPPPLDKPRGKPIGAYATAVLKDGSQLLEVMSLEEIERVRSVSKAKDNEYGPWVQWWTEMARKTVMRRLSKRLPMSSDLYEEISRDETVADRVLPQQIEAEPRPQNVSRLDALEAHIGAEQIEDADFTPQPSSDGDGSAAEQAGPSHEPAKEEAPVQPAEEKPSLAERMAANADAEKARQGGTKPAAEPALTLAAAKAEIDRLELVTDIRGYLSSLRGVLPDADLSAAEEYGFAKIGRLEGVQ